MQEGENRQNPLSGLMPSDWLETHQGSSVWITAYRVLRVSRDSRRTSTQYRARYFGSLRFHLYMVGSTIMIQVGSTLISLMNANGDSMHLHFTCVKLPKGCIFLYSHHLASQAKKVTSLLPSRE